MDVTLEHGFGTHAKVSVSGSEDERRSGMP